MTRLLDAQGISKSYGKFQALKRVSFHVDDGEFVSIVGPNGAGKSTIVNVLSGLARPDGGMVEFMGQSIAGVGPVRLGQRGMARAFQLVNIFPELTVGETISVAVTARLKRVSRIWRAARADREVQGEVARVAAVLGLEQCLDVVAMHLSQGEKKLLDIASALALRPRLILLDEPTSGVSSGDKFDIMDLLVKAARAEGVRGIVQVEHDMDLVARYSHRIVALQEGCVIGDMPPDRFFTDPLMLSAVIGKIGPVQEEVEQPC